MEQVPLKAPARNDLRIGLDIVLVFDSTTLVSAELFWFKDLVTELSLVDIFGFLSLVSLVY